MSSSVVDYSNSLPNFLLKDAPNDLLDIHVYINKSSDFSDLWQLSKMSAGDEITQTK